MAELVQDALAESGIKDQVLAATWEAVLGKEQGSR